MQKVRTNRGGKSEKSVVSIKTMATPTTPTQERTIQDAEYRQSFLNDVKTRNEKVVEMMDVTVVVKEEQESTNRLEALNSFSPEQRRRLMSGEKLESILPPKAQSKYYNTSNQAVESIPKDDLFIYQIGDHLMAYEVNDVSVDDDIKTIELPVVVYNPEKDEYEEHSYCINDPDVFDILKSQLKKDEDFSISRWNSSEGNYSDSTESGSFGSPPHPHPHPSQFASDNFNDIDDINRWSTCLPPNSTEFPPTDENYIKQTKTIRKIQDTLFEKLLSIYQGESVYSQQIYTPAIEDRIREMLGNNFFPFQIVSNLIAEFTM